MGAVSSVFRPACLMFTKSWERPVRERSGTKYAAAAEEAPVLAIA
jgi:hypothetical protein